MILLTILIVISVFCFVFRDEPVMMVAPFMGAICFFFAFAIIHEPHNKYDYSESELVAMKAELQGYQKAIEVEGLPPKIYSDLSSKINKLENETDPDVLAQREQKAEEKRWVTHFDLSTLNAVMLACLFIFCINPLVFNKFEYIRNKIEKRKKAASEQKRANQFTHELHPLIGGWLQGDIIEINFPNSYPTKQEMEFVSFREKEIFYKNKAGSVESVHPYYVQRNKTFNEERHADYIVSQEDKDFYVEQQRQFAKEFISKT